MQVYTAFDPNSEAGERFLKLIRWMLRGFILLGLVFLAVALVFLGKALVTRTDFAETEGTITGFSADGFPTVEYEVEGQTYRFDSNATSSSLREGQSYKVQYRIADPADARSPVSAYILPIVFGALGVGFTVIPWVVKKFTVDLIEKIEEEQEQQPVRL